jgi:hypothetical protein
MCGVYKLSQYLRQTDTTNGLNKQQQKDKDQLIMPLLVVYICEYVCAV